MEESITILQEQLREKDKQIERLQAIIDNLTKDDEEEPDEETPKPHVPKFWERHVKLSYVMLAGSIILVVLVFISPFLVPSLFKLLGSSKQMIYIYTLIIVLANCFIVWMNTPEGRKWKNGL